MVVLRDVTDDAHAKAGPREGVPCDEGLRHPHRWQPPQRPHLVLIVQNTVPCFVVTFLKDISGERVSIEGVDDIVRCGACDGRSPIALLAWRQQATGRTLSQVSSGRQVDRLE